MTRDEAKSVLFDMLGKGIYVKNTKENQAILVALRALEQKPCDDWYDVPSDEMTLEQARQAVKDLRKMWAEHLEQEPCEYEELDFVQPHKKIPVNLVICNPKEVYNKGFADGQKALAEHLKLCKEELLNKIRNELKGKYRIVLKDTPKDDWSIKWNECIDEVLEVIDKYKL